jgi:hemoglobin-like flavoprotein
LITSEIRFSEVDTVHLLNTSHLNVMTEKQILLVKHSWSYIAGQADEMALVFANNLILLDPGLKPLTQQLITENKLTDMMMTVNYFVAALPDLQKAENKVLDLIAKYSTLELSEKYYDIAWLAFLQSLHKKLGDTWDQEIHDAWITGLTSMHKYLLDHNKLSSVN